MIPHPGPARSEPPGAPTAPAAAGTCPAPDPDGSPAPAVDPDGAAAVDPEGAPAPDPEGAPAVDPDGAPGVGLGVDSGTADAELPGLAARLLVDANRAQALRLEAMWVFHAHRVAEAEAKAAGQPGPWDQQPGFFWLTPLQATKAEFGPLLVTPEGFIESDLTLVTELRRWVPAVWDRCLAGRLDLARARAVHAQLEHLATDADRAAYGTKVAQWLARRDDPAAPVVPVPYRSLQAAAHRLCRTLPQRTPPQTFAAAYTKRRVRLRVDDGTGMATLACFTAVHDAQRADHRLTLIAKKRREATGEDRTLDQLRADTLIDLLCGRLTAPVTDAELAEDCLAGAGCADHEHGPPDAPCPDPATRFDWAPIGQFGRPVINVTVPITTLMGLSDDGGLLAGGIHIPADLAQHIACDPDAVWYRLLTDPAGRFAELSTTAYTPTEPIWRCVVARDVSCVFPGCHRPATIVELDHRVPWPHGQTSVWNLQPLCKKHHKVKHSHGYTVTREADGSYTWTSRFGTTTHTPAPDYPTPVWDQLATTALTGGILTPPPPDPTPPDPDSDPTTPGPHPEHLWAHDPWLDAPWLDQEWSEHDPPDLTPEEQTRLTALHRILDTITHNTPPTTDP